MESDTDVLARAVELARTAHRGQVYPAPQPEPYIEHPLRVMESVQGTHAKIAAVLHDVLEDTGLRIEDLQGAGIPPDVIDAVVALTHTPELSYEEYIEQVAPNEIAREVKLADLADNLRNNNRLTRTPDVIARIKRYESAVARLRRRSHRGER